MTCKEFVSALEVDPADHTRAMLKAISDHAASCKPCYRVIFDGHEERVRRMDPAEYRVLRQEMACLAARVKADPETGA